MTLDERAEALASDLGVDKQEVKADLENLVEYSVPLDEAADSLRRKYGDGDARDGPTAVDLAEVTTDTGTVTATARVLTVGKRPIRYQGEDHVIFEGELADETGRIAYTAWEDFDLEVGETVTVGNAGVREWEGRPELNLGESTTVTREDDTLDVPYQVGGEADLTDLDPGDRGVALAVRVDEVEERTIDGRDGETDILSGVLADGSARLPFTDWEPRAAVAEGATLRVENAYVREFRGVPSVNFSEFTAVETADLDLDAPAPERATVREAVAGGGAYDVELVGNVVDLQDGSGIIQRCPECGRVVQSGQCRQHGDVEPEDDLRTKAVLDDGTGTVTAVLDRETTERIYGGDLDDALSAAREAMDQSVVAEALAEELVGGAYRVRGHLSVDEYGANLEATSFEPATGAPAELARDLLEVAE